MKSLKRTVFIIFLMFLLVFFLEIFASPPGGRAFACCGINWPAGGTSTGSGDDGNDPPDSGQTGDNDNDPSDGDPVNMNSGNYSREKRLFFYPSRGMPTVISAFYNSQEVFAGSMGLGWSHSFDVSLVRLSDDTRVILWGDGRRERYVPKEGGGYTPPPGNFDTLTEGHNGYTLRTKYGTEYLFLSLNPIKALLSTVKDRNRNTITLNYDQNGILISLTDTAGRTFIFNYTGERLTSIGDPSGRSVTFSYNQEGLLSSIADPMGNTVHYGYNARKKLSSITDPKEQTYLTQTYDDYDFPRVTSQNYGGQSFSLSYNFRQATATATKNGRNTTYFYAPDTGFQTQMTDPLGHSTRATYDDYGNLVQSFNPKHDYPTCFFYDDKGNCTRIERPMNIVTTFTYEPNFSQVTSATDPNGNTSAFTYDSNGNRLTATNPLGETSSFSYDNSGQLTQVTDAKGHSTLFSYDKEGNLTTLTDHLQNTWTFGYDDRGNRVSAQDPLNHTTFTTYNLNSQVRAVKDPLDHITSFSYDENGKLLSVTDANGSTTSYEYTVLDMLSRVTDSMNQSISYSYNQDGLLSSITNARGNTTSFTYDSLERLVQTEDPLGRTTSVGYDSNGNVTSRTDGNGSTTVYSYDDIDRVTRRTFGDQSSVEYQYDSGSRRTVMVDRDGNATTYSYNAASRLTSVSARGQAINYGYDGVGNVLSVEVPDGGQTTNYAYNAGNRLSQVSHGGSAAKGGIPLPAGKVWSYSYDAAGRLTSLVRPNGVTSNYSYNECNWLTLLAHTSGQTPILSFQYTYNNIGNRISKTVTDGQGQQVWGYEYDNVYRLTTETYPDTHDVVYTYDRNGNRLSRAGNGETVNYSYDAADQLLSSGATSCHWDGNGNLIRKTDGNGTTNYAYDNENLLSQITLPDGTTESYGYNGDGLRVQKTRGGIETNYILSGADVLGEDSSEGGPPRTYYILGGSMAGPLALKQPGEEASVYHFPLTDGQGSVIMLTDEDGNISDGYDYDAFGVGMTPSFNPPPNTTYNPYRYTGQQTDAASGLVYLRNRYYDPNIGRFITQDPIGFDGGINFYAYCGNNPVNLVDPWGLDVYLIRYTNDLGIPPGHIALAVDDPSKPGSVRLIDPRENNIANSREYGSLDQLIAGEHNRETTLYGGHNPNILSKPIATESGSNAEQSIINYWAQNRTFNYNPVTNNCAHYVLDALEAGGFDAIYTAMYRGEIQRRSLNDPGQVGMTPGAVWDSEIIKK